MTDKTALLKKALIKIQRLEKELAQAQQALEQAQSQPQAAAPVAIVGIGVRMPGMTGRGPDAFWRMLRDGVDAISEVPSDRWDVDAYYDPDGGPGKMTTRWGGFMPEVDKFDAPFFGISPREAERMDPQQRLVLETAWEALEDAGIPAESLAGRKVGVFMGVSNFDYSRVMGRGGDLSIIDAYMGTGNAFSIVANRLSYLLDARGPSVAIDTACSSSLVTVHLAVRSLQTGESDLALAGGVNLMLSPEPTITFSQAGMLSPEGRCKTFDASADGYVRGEGVGVIVLKRLEDALRDGDHIWAVIRGSAVNQDGASNGLTAPNAQAQKAVIREAWAVAGLEPKDAGYIEAHGTGTNLGDPIEARALGEVLAGRPPQEPVWVGSVKTNIGHLESAAGIAGVIKTALALYHETIPPHLHFKQINPHIPIDELPLAIPTQRIPWPKGNGPRYAGVSSFGFGGTNAHIVLGEAPDAPPPVVEERPGHVLVLSARDDRALNELAAAYARFLDERPDLALGDICYNAATTRSALERRLAVSGLDRAEIKARLRIAAGGQAAAGVKRGQVRRGERRRVAWLFTGQGAQYPGMGRKLYESEPVFKDALDRCAAILDRHLDTPLFDVLFPDDPEDARIHETAYTQPALFAIEYALAELWRSWGLKPDFVLGHSVGEYVAAVVAGVMSLEDGLKLIAARGRLMQALPRDEGSMAVIFAPVAEVAPAVAPYAEGLAVAGVNGPSNTVISGRKELVDEVASQFEAQGVRVRRLKVSHAFHSPLMAPMLDEFEAAARTIAYKPPTIRLVSNVTGQIFEPGQVPDAAYWRRHVMAAVQFEAGMRALAAKGAQVFLEVGPHPVLIGVGKRILEKNVAWVPSLRRDEDDLAMILDAAGGLFTAGVELDWDAFFRGPRQRIRLPLYPFQRRRYWLETKPAASLVVEQELVSGVIQVLDEDGNVRIQGDRVKLARLADGRQVLLLESEEEAEPEAPEVVEEAAEAKEDIITPELVRNTEGERRRVVLTAYLRQEIARVLRMTPAEIPSDQPLIYLGMDSIMAAELKNAVDQALQIAIPIEELVKGPSLDDLVAVILPLIEQAPTGVPLRRYEEDLPEYPLSYGQRAMWFQHQVSPDSIFNPTYAARVRAPLDVERLKARFDALFRRHDSLRTQFFTVKGEPRQRIVDEIPPYFHRVNARGWDDVRLHQTLAEWARRPFDLVNGPLLRLVAFEMGDEDYVILLSAHHIVVDLWSLAVLLGELSVIWPVEDPEAALPSVPVRYVDFVRWQLEMLESPQGEELWAYWKERLAGELPLLNLPTDHPRPPVQTFRGATKTLKLGRTLSQAIKDLSERHGATTYMTLLAAFKVLLRRYTGQEDIIVGTPTAGRTQPAVENVVGYFVNPVPLRSDLSGNPRFSDFLRQEKEVVLGALAHQDYPFNLMVEKLAPERSAAYTPIFQVMFVLQRAHRLHEEGLSQFALDAEGLEMDLGGIPLTSIPIEEQKTPMDLTMIMAETGEELAASITYNTDLFEERTVNRMLRHFQMLLHSIADGPEQTIGELRMLTEAEKRTLIEDWNHTRAPIPNQTFHQIVETHAARRPNALALTFEDQRLTYGELNARANQLAHLLIARGVKPETPVGIMLPRSLDMIVAMLGVLKAGGAYLPIDPTYPPERIRFMIEDSGIGILLSQSDLSKQFSVFSVQCSEEARASSLKTEHLTDGHQAARASSPTPEIQVICLDELNTEHLPTTNPNVSLSPDNLAYIIYTSGSTGRPKGVMLHHRGLVNFILGQRKVYGGSSSSRVLQFASFSFDAATSEIVWALANGGSLHLARRETLLSEKKLAELMQRHDVNAAILPPTILKDYDPGRFPTLATVVSAGEACTWDIVERWLPGRVFLNGYGPTETTIGPTGYRVRGILRDTATVPVGRPLYNVRVYLLDEFLQPVPVGVPGEIYIGGPGVGRGYLGRPEITAERFLPDPFASEPGGRMYRTGDLGRWLPGGDIEFLGRVDFQVKIRGFRVELGEIDNLLLRHPAVEDALTLARTDAPGGPCLVAYVQPRPGERLTAGELRAFLEKDLPDYMIPSHFMILDAFPLSPNGKVDRKRLPVPSADRPELATDYVPPRNETERKIAAIWREALGLDKVGVNDNFFELGGHSLLLAKVNEQLEQTFDQSFSMVDLFRYPTIAQLAKRVSAGGDNKKSVSAEARERAARRGQRRPPPRRVRR